MKSKARVRRAFFVNPTKQSKSEVILRGGSKDERHYSRRSVRTNKR